MKKLLLMVAAVAALSSCSKDAENVLQETSADRTVLNVSGSFDVGQIDAAGNGVITYNMAELSELCACAVSEDIAAGLIIDKVPGIGYYLSGIASSVGSHTTFSITLGENNGKLSWADNASIFTCLTTSATPCNLNVVDYDVFNCTNTSGVCGENTIGGENGGSYNDCNWPWLIPGKSKS